MGNNISFKAAEKENKNINTYKSNKIKDFSDSFVKHSAQSAPMLLALTGVWSIIDKKSAKIPLGKSFVNNLSHFFLPVLLISSTILSLFENKNNNKQEK